MGFAEDSRGEKARRTNDLYLDIDLNQFLGQGIDLDKTRVNGPIESTEFRHKTNVPLVDGFVWIRTDTAARDGSQEANARTERVDWSVVSWSIKRT